MLGQQLNLLGDSTKSIELPLTITKQFENKGIEKVAKNLLVMKIDHLSIQKATGLSSEQIEDLKKKK